MSGRTIRIAISIAISAVLLFFALRGIHWEEAATAARGANYWYMLPLIAATIWTLIIRAQRWRLFLKPLGVPDLRTLIAATNIGFMCNMVLPLRVGEVIRPGIVARKEGVPIGGLLATIFLERVFDMFMVILLFGVSALLVEVSDDAKAGGMVLTGLAFAIAIGMGLLRWQEKFWLGVAQAICDRLPPKLGEPIMSLFAGFVKALEILASPGDFIRAFAWTFYLWMMIAFVNACGLLAFALPLESAILFTAIVAIAVAVPAAPGFIGSFQAGCVIALTIFGIEKDRIIAFSLVLHIVQFLTIVAVGLFSLWTENLSLHQVEELEGEAG